MKKKKQKKVESRRVGEYCARKNDVTVNSSREYYERRKARIVKIRGIKS